MRVALAQMNVKQSEFENNFKSAMKIASKAKEGKADLVVFPEMFLSGFHYGNNKKAILDGFVFSEKISQIAKENKIFVCGSVPCLSKNDLLSSNRMIMSSDDGHEICHYDKIHLFKLFREEKYIKAGKNVVVANTKFGKIGFAICFDLRFPEMFTDLRKSGVEIIILSSAWPHPRFLHWDILTKARAIETQSILIAVNQCGEENFGTSINKYFGSSRVINANGDMISEAMKDKEDLLFCDIDVNSIKEVRSHIDLFSDRNDSNF